MSGHSKWANIKHRKEKSDARKGKEFTRVAKEIINAVRQGGPDPKSNSKLRLAIQKAKAVNMPNDNVERNIKKASSADQSDYASMTYELYGHGGVGIILDIMTDNKNRIASDIRIAINKCGGRIANPGAVAFNFDRKGVILVDKKKAIEDELFLIATEAGAEDFEATEEDYIITTSLEDLMKVKEEIEKKEISVKEASFEYIPKVQVACSKEDQEANIKLLEWLENLDDVDSVYHNMEITE
jgi:YebC/PmpR family DNA-binding regulatory protein